MNSLLILFGKLVLLISKTLNLGSGSTWPGHIAMETNSNFVRDVLKKNPNLKVVLIAGTNGKTTTSLMLMKILEESGLKVFRNEAGANLLNGIASSIIQNSSLNGKLNHDVAIFEVDENNLGEVLNQMSHVKGQMSIVLSNLFRDQLDRYGEVNTIAKKWEEALFLLPEQTMIFTNGDDPKLSCIALNSKHKVNLFGLDEKLMTNDKPGYDVDFTYCPKCQTKLVYKKVSYSHLGRFSCSNCGLTNPETKTFPTLPHSLFGKYNIYNTNAAALVAERAFDVSIEKIRTALENFKPAFGRQEAINYKGRNVLLLLSKNPAGFNQSIDAIGVIVSKAKQSPNVLLVLNDRIPDGRDVSWIWDIDIDALLPVIKNIFISGDRVYDMALRVKYSQMSNAKCQMFENLSQAIEQSIEQTKPDETLFILPTYSAMLETRKILTGKKIL